MEKRKQVVILAAGDVPSHPVPLRTLREADMVVCCDSAYRAIANSRLEVENYVVIGDGDSLPESDKRALGERWVHVAEQDYNDLHKAMAWVMSGEWRVESGERREERGVCSDLSGSSPLSTLRSPLSTLHSPLKISILGATGRREDHTLGNISYLVTFAEEYPGIDLEMLTDHGRLCAMRGSRTFACFPRQQVSVFSLDPEVPIYGTGLRWPLEGFRARRWWQATLNEAVGTEFTLRSEGWLVLFRTYDPK